MRCDELARMKEARKKERDLAGERYLIRRYTATTEQFLPALPFLVEIYDEIFSPKGVGLAPSPGLI
jgi:hypothetical protein